MNNLTQLLSALKRAAEFDDKPIHYIGDDGTNQAIYSKQGRAYENSRLQPILQAQQEVLERVCAALKNVQADLDDLDSNLMAEYKIVMSGFSRAKRDLSIALAYATERLELVVKEKYMP